MIYLCTGRIPTRIGNRYEAIYPYDSFKAKDGDVIIACGNDKLYGLLKGVLKIDALEDGRFASNILRVQNHAPLKEIIEKWTRERTIDEIVDMLLEAGIPSAPINTIDRVTKDPHIANAREMFIDTDHPVAGKVRITGTPLKFSNHHFEVYRPAPGLGENTEEILGSIGISAETIKTYREEGVI
jgi:crotonobetainyl-CoA:carnitine CoA-transferase CaiB-like acyl-CoA transferase